MYEKDTEEQVVLESVYIAMDPVLEGFEGVLVEMILSERRYILTETAIGSGNRSLTFVSSNYDLVRRLFLECTAPAESVQQLLL